MGRLLCRVRLHHWGPTEGFMGPLPTPVRTCKRKGCGWHEVFMGYATILYPPGSIIFHGEGEPL